MAAEGGKEVFSGPKTHLSQEDERGPHGKESNRTYNALENPKNVHAGGGQLTTLLKIAKRKSCKAESWEIPQKIQKSASGQGAEWRT